MVNKWLWSANLMGIAFKFIRMEQTYIFSRGRFDFVRYQRHVLLVPSITYMQTFVGSSSADLCLLVSCLRFIRSPLRTRCQFCVPFPDTKIALSFGYHAFVGGALLLVQVYSI